MHILFIHQNFPGQFKYLAPALAAKGHKVTALAIKKGKEFSWQGVRVVPYGVAKSSTQGIHPWLVDFETKVIRGEACFQKALELRDSEGYCPDAVIAHPGWGESMFLKEVWPKVKLGIYCEFYYRAEGADSGFDPEFSNNSSEGSGCRLRMKNLNSLLHIESTDAAISPTQWQAKTFPHSFQSKITVVHDGIDTRRIVPDSSVSISFKAKLGGKVVLSRRDEVITFVNRNLEPYRGFHVFMRALPNLLRKRPHARILIVGGDDVSYGAKPQKGRSWKEIFINEIRSFISDSDWERVYFLGRLSYDVFLRLLQLSTVHVYLTYPFVLSWSLLEAMSSGCAIVASDTPPLHEAIRDNENGLLVNFFDSVALVDKICFLLDNYETRSRLGQAARKHVCRNYDLTTVCLPQQIIWVESLLSRGAF